MKFLGTYKDGSVNFHHTLPSFVEPIYGTITLLKLARWPEPLIETRVDPDHAYVVQTYERGDTFPAVLENGELTLQKDIPDDNQVVLLTLELPEGGIYQLKTPNGMTLLEALKAHIKSQS